MQESRVFKGYWFLPNDPDKKIAGILSFVPFETLKLELIGGFDTPQDYLMNVESEEVDYDDIIWGIDEDAKRITLVNCAKYGKLNLSSEFPMINYTIDYAIIGVHINSWEEKAFFKLEAKLPLFTKWINKRRVSFSTQYSNSDNRRLGFDIKFRTDDHENTVLKIKDNFTIAFKHNCYIPENQLFKREIEEHYTLEIQSEVNVDFWTFILAARKFAKFLTLACRSEIGFDELQLSCKNYYQEYRNGRMFYNPIQLLYIQERPTVLPETKKAKDFLIDYQSIKQDFPEIINNWYGFDRNMSPILQHLIESINNNPVFRSVDFLVICQALEGFHTRFKNHSKISLKDRLQELVTEFSYVNEIKDIPICITVNSRHYYSHLYLEDDREIYKGHELYQLTITLRKLLICCLFKFIGLSDEKITEVMSKNFD